MDRAYHFYLARKGAEYYTFVVEGEKEHVEEWMINTFAEVRFKKTEKIGSECEKWLRGNKALPNNCYVRDCRFSYYLRKMGEFDKPNVLEFDSRHEVLVA